MDPRLVREMLGNSTGSIDLEFITRVGISGKDDVCACREKQTKAVDHRGGEKRKRVIKPPHFVCASTLRPSSVRLYPRHWSEETLAGESIDGEHQTRNSMQVDELPWCSLSLPANIRCMRLADDTPWVCELCHYSREICRNGLSVSG